jgi:hypothetical protein
LKLKEKMEKKIEYLEFSKTDQENSVEELFCGELERTGKINPLDKDMMKLLVTLVTNKSAIDEIYEDARKMSFLIPILEDRLKTMNRELDKASAIFIGLACQTPGDSVMYSYYIAYQMKKKGIGKKLTLEEICMSIFPNGLFDSESMDEVWDKQKVNRDGSGSDNLLDYRKASESLIYEENA